MDKVGAAGDNAVMEPFFAPLKNNVLGPVLRRSLGHCEITSDALDESLRPRSCRHGG